MSLTEKDLQLITKIVSNLLDYKLDQKFGIYTKKFDSRFDQLDKDLNYRFKEWAAIITGNIIEEMDIRFGKVEEKVEENEVRSKKNEYDIRDLQLLIKDE